MIVILVFAFLSGIVTILSPCILPVLPIVLSGTVGGGKARPFGIVTGFVVTFTVFTLALSALVQTLGISPDALRIVAVVVLVLFGLVMVVPKLREHFDLFTAKMANLGRVAGERGQQNREKNRLSGFFSGLPVGFSLGLVWTPCVGPIMASVISLAITQEVSGAAVLVTLAYTLGTSIPMLAIMVGGRALLKKSPAIMQHIGGIQRVFGILMIAVGAAIGFGWDRQFQTAVLTAFPRYGTGLTAIEDTELVRDALDTTFARETAGGLGPAPELIAEGPWLNTGGMSITNEDLAGKVVLIDFWTYSCVNCVRTIPHLAAWYEAYHDQGFEIIGVHTPEFAFEKSTGNVQRAIEDLGVTWPVVQDNNFRLWRAYGNRYWPAHYFIDAKGQIRHVHFGEGEYDTSEAVIRALLAEAGSTVTGRPRTIEVPEFTSRTPEIYLGYGRASGFVSTEEIVPNATERYTAGRMPENAEWRLEGRWQIKREWISPEESGVLELGFNAKNVFLVIEPVIEPTSPAGRITVVLDGRPGAVTPDVKDGILLPDESRLYQVVGLEKAGAHVLRLEVTGALRLFAFTFG